MRYPKSHSAEERERVVQAASEVYKLPIYYDERRGLKLAQVRSTCRNMKSKYGCKLFIIDHILLIGHHPNDRRTRHAQLTEASADLAELSDQLQAPFLVLVQLGRDVEKDERPPRLSDLKESGDLEQNADVVVLLSRLYEKEIKKPPLALKNAGEKELGRVRRITIAKQRGGIAGPYYNRYQTFEETFTLFRDVRYPESATTQADWHEGPNQ